MLHDKAELVFNSHNSFLERLEEVQVGTEWKEVSIMDLDICQNLIDFTEADYDTNTNGTKMFVDFPFGKVGIRECALRTLYTNLGLGGELMKKLDTDDMEEYVVFGIGKNRKYRSKMTFQLPIVEGKVNAFLSESYSNDLPADEVFRQVLKHFQNKLEQESFKFNGFWSYAECAGDYYLPISKEIDGKEYSTVLVVRTSDAGYSSISFSAYLTDGYRKEIPVMNGVSAIHKGNAASAERLEEMLNMVENAIDNGVKKLNKLLHIIIANPKSTMKRICKEVGLPKRESLELIDRFAEGTTTAFECYMCLSQILESDLTFSIRERYQGNLYKMLGINWDRYDLPGDYAW
ncbi:MAG: hypothetical protein IJI66_14075 [Erysipelotrichaceae bacterium]|nr:hypothetical protein [Erysipelotrichaceae bacterium]